MKAEISLKVWIDIKEETYYHYLVFEIIKLNIFQLKFILEGEKYGREMQK